MANKKISDNSSTSPLDTQPLSLHSVDQKVEQLSAQLAQVLKYLGKCTTDDDLEEYVHQLRGSTGSVGSACGILPSPDTPLSPHKISCAHRPSLGMENHSDREPEEEPIKYHRT